MEKYNVKLSSRAYWDLDRICAYIAEILDEPATALKIDKEPEEAILSLEQFPMRGSIRKTGTYASRGYRQLFVKKYVLIYRVLKEKKEVQIVTVRYAPSNF